MKKRVLALLTLVFAFSMAIGVATVCAAPSLQDAVGKGSLTINYTPSDTFYKTGVEDIGWELYEALPKTDFGYGLTAYLNDTVSSGEGLVYGELDANRITWIGQEDLSTLTGDTFPLGEIPDGVEGVPADGDVITLWAGKPGTPADKFIGGAKVSYPQRPTLTGAEVSGSATASSVTLSVEAILPNAEEIEVYNSTTKLSSDITGSDGDYTVKVSGTFAHGDVLTVKVKDKDGASDLDGYEDQEVTLEIKYTATVNATLDGDPYTVPVFTIGDDKLPNGSKFVKDRKRSIL
ncbi:MAG: hypothetical protein LBK41_01140, partial [Clostridiales bacterium]|nr:hypothetical protein [Clostridiales bacterium]